ncbi:ribosome maturation factor RimP [Levilactobacillus spicheri]|uniref:Ribosome maturation factor RimP n=1 Tax=Levilactobacillus spicheri TaxID=216463 RepID=A0A0F3RQ88_9LACO|nr:ribosome maturation factor RimP [Levilactobacillus spicheri]KJW12193.1 ribosome maturation protein RimP [Levilactobacillus spicheri]GEO65854.1 ribosome maturation factor RimP [Levilactobacillus spicheri]
MSTVVETVTNLVQPIVAHHQFDLVDVEFVKEGKSWYLRIYIDKPGGINIEECALVSDEVSEKLDALDPDPIPQAYFLEVSSPGAERPLKKPEDFDRAVGDYIHVSLYQKIGASKVYEGTLEKLTAETLYLKVNLKGRFKTFEIPRKGIAQARLAIKF